MEDKALIELFRDLLEYKKREAKFLFIALIAVVIMNITIVGAFLYFEAHMQTSVTTTKTTTTEQEIQSDDGNIVNGNQYNDNAQDRGNE